MHCAHKDSHLIAYTAVCSMKGVCMYTISMHAAIESQRVAIVRSRCQRLQSGVQGAGGAMCTQLRFTPHCVHLTQQYVL